MNCRLVAVLWVCCRFRATIQKRNGSGFLLHKEGMKGNRAFRFFFYICAYLKRISNSSAAIFDRGELFVIVVFSVPFGTFEIFHLRMQLADSADILRVVPLALRHRLSPGLPHILICLAGVDGVLVQK